MSVLKQASTSINVCAMNLGSHLVTLVPVGLMENLQTEL